MGQSQRGPAVAPSVVGQAPRRKCPAGSGVPSFGNQLGKPRAKVPRRFWGTELRGPSRRRQRPRGEYQRQGQDRCSRRVRLSRYRQPQDNLTERTHRAAHAAPSGRVAGASLEGLQGGGAEGRREEGKNRDRRRVEQGRTRQRPRSQPLSHEYYRSLFLFGIRGRYVSPGVCVGCCLGEDTKLAAAPLAQKLFSDQVGGGHRGGAAGTPWRLGRSCHPTQLASQQCTQMPQNGTERPFSPICVHSFVLTSVHNGAKVYTNTPKRLQGAIFADLCTLLTVSTSDRATGRRHGSHDVDGPMAP